MLIGGKLEGANFDQWTAKYMKEKAGDAEVEVRVLVLVRVREGY